jgi:hypothetical protein
MAREKNMIPTSRTHLSPPKETQPVHYQALPPSETKLLYCTGPDIDSDSSQWLRQMMISTGMPLQTMRSQANQARAGQHVSQALRELASDGQVFLDMHGLYSDKHRVRSGWAGSEVSPTGEMLMRLVQQLPQAENSKNGSHDGAKPVFHLISCQSGGLRNDLQPGTPSWRAAYVITYANKKGSSSVTQYSSAFTVVMRYLQRCQQSQQAVNPIKLFLLAGLRRGDCMSLLGGELHQALVWHAPKAAADLDDSNDCFSSLRGDPADVARLIDLVDTLSHEERALLPPLQQATKDIFAARLSRHDKASMRSILRTERDLIRQADVLGDCPVHHAVEDNSPQDVNFLLLNGASLKDKTVDGFTPLMLMAQAGKIEMLEHLLDLGADPNELHASGNSVLMLAIRAGNLLAVSLLLARGADPHYHYGVDSVLSVARECGQTVIAKLLQDIGVAES